MFATFTITVTAIILSRHIAVLTQFSHVECCTSQKMCQTLAMKGYRKLPDLYFFFSFLWQNNSINQLISLLRLIFFEGVLFIYDEVPPKTISFLLLRITVYSFLTLLSRTGLISLTSRTASRL